MLMLKRSAQSPFTAASCIPIRVKTSSLKLRGFTLIELVVGIMVLGIALLMISSILGPMYIRSSEPWHQVRAAELGHSLMNEIMARSFDENSSRGANLLRCGETGAQSCIASIPACPSVGMSSATEEASRDLYDDVDDFHCFRGDGVAVSNILDQSLADSYRNYQVSVLVSYAGADVGLPNQSAKRVDISVTLPSGEIIPFSSYKGNW
jgi:MSHA pilin protein MshD